VNGVEVPLPPSATVSSGERVTLSIRPEAIRLGTGETTLEATVESVEFLGDAYRVHCDWDGRSLLVKTDEDRAPEGAIRLGFDAEDVHLLPEGLESDASDDGSAAGR
jgi:thiamine transport system ATP-binding protein